MQDDPANKIIARAYVTASGQDPDAKFPDGRMLWEHYYKRAIGIRAALTRAGYTMVPVQITAAMKRAGGLNQAVWREVLRAATSPAPAEPEDPAIQHFKKIVDARAPAPAPAEQED